MLDLVCSGTLAFKERLATKLGSEVELTPALDAKITELSAKVNKVQMHKNVKKTDESIKKAKNLKNNNLVSVHLAV